MKLLRVLAATLLVVSTAGCSEFMAGKDSNNSVARKIIDASIAAYSGNCPCPYNINAAGNSCGATSAYSRAGGASPICYEHQVTPAMITAYRA